MILRVTAADIREGRRYSPFYCPIARALRRQIGGKRIPEGMEPIAVGSAGARAFHRNFCLSKRATDFIDAFDTHGRKAVRPASFRLTEVKS